MSWTEQRMSARMAMLVSPAEPVALRGLGRVSSLPERLGCDFLFFANGKKVGVQRKEVRDLRASVGDGRLAKELAQMDQCGIERKLLILEGKVSWGPDGKIMDRWGPEWTRAQWYGVLWSVQARGMWVVTTGSMGETAEVLLMFEKWCGKNRHSSLETRPKIGGIWGSRPDAKEWGVWMLQGLDGVGAELAGRIWDQFGGLPFGWREGMREEDLEQVEGIGKKKAAKIWKAIDGGKV